MFRRGILTKKNAHEIAQQITNLLKGKVWCVATVYLIEHEHEVDINLDCVLQADWTDGSKELVRVGVDENYASIHFAGGGFSHIYLSQV